MDQAESSIFSLSDSNSSFGATPLTLPNSTSFVLPDFQSLNKVLKEYLNRLQSTWLELGEESHEKERMFLAEIEELVKKTLAEELKRKEDISNKVREETDTLKLLSATLNEPCSLVSFLCKITAALHFFLLNNFRINNSHFASLGSLRDAKTFNSSLEIPYFSKKTC